MPYLISNSLRPGSKRRVRSGYQNNIVRVDKGTYTAVFKIRFIKITLFYSKSKHILSNTAVWYSALP